MTVQTSARNATTADLVKILNEQQARKLDIVVPATSMKMSGGNLVVKGSEVHMDENGVTQVNGTYRPTRVFDAGIAAKLDVPKRYVDRLRAERVDLLDTNFNGLLHGRKVHVKVGPPVEVHAADPRRFLLRLFKGDDGGEGVARALLSDKYALSMDNIDMLTAVMSGITETGVRPVVRVSDLSETRMRVRFEFPDVSALAPGLLDGYRSPFDHGAVRAGAFDTLRQQYGAHHMFQRGSEPLAYMGFDFSNSETGDGKYRLTPVIGVVRCTNGLVMTREGLSRTHLGAKLDDGPVAASAETLQRAGALVVSQTKDAVTKWLGDGYLQEMLAELEGKAVKPLTQAAETVPAICQGLGFSDEEKNGVLDMFVMSGQATAGGLMQAVSAYAQTVEDVDRAYEIELKAVEALEIAARR